MSGPLGHEQDAPCPAPRRADEGVAVRCDGCGYDTVVTSRSQFGIIEELHRTGCDIEALSYDGDTDGVLSLPPYPSDDD